MPPARLSDFGIRIGELPPGPLNKLSDVPGVRVGHCTIDSERHKTGVTIISPGPADLFTHKPAAGCCVLNGFGKTTGLVQLEELGTLETPIALTNTLNVGRVHDALVEHMLEQAAAAGVNLISVNPLVAECNDAYLNDIQSRPVRGEHVRRAFADLRVDFAEGAVGAGAGMSCFQLKGGIGSASRRFALGGQAFTLGALALANFGALRDLRLDGRPVGRELEPVLAAQRQADQGSVILVLACDAPLSDRQLRRVSRRAGVGLARLGSQLGHGSGDIAIAFSTANAPALDEPGEIITLRCVREDRLDLLFRAAAESVEEAVLNAMLSAPRTVGFQGRVRESLADYLPALLGRPPGAGREQ
ncbi:MAG: P1 family peptidase [Chloroflexota bacterium]